MDRFRPPVFYVGFMPVYLCRFHDRLIGKMNRFLKRGDPKSIPFSGGQNGKTPMNSKGFGAFRLLQGVDFGSHFPAKAPSNELTQNLDGNCPKLSNSEANHLGWPVFYVGFMASFLKIPYCMPLPGAASEPMPGPASGLNFCLLSGPFWDPFWAHFGPLLGPFWDSF